MDGRPRRPGARARNPQHRRTRDARRAGTRVRGVYRLRGAGVNDDKALIAPCAVEKPSVARRSLAAVRLVLRDRLLQVAVFRARQEARLVERGQALLGAREIAGLQVELARVFERAAVCRVDAQRFVVELLGSGEIGRRAFAQAVTHQVVPVGVAGVVQALELVDRAGPVPGGDLLAHGGELVGRGLRAGLGVGGKGARREQQRAGDQSTCDDGLHKLILVVELSDTLAASTGTYEAGSKTDAARA